MKQLRSLACAALVFSLSFGWVAGHPQKAVAGQRAATYILTVTTAAGAFASRQVITLHPDHSIFVIDSGQEAASNSFSSEQGVWESNDREEFVAHAFDFDFKPISDVARADYAFRLGPGGTVKGTITLRVFPINGDPRGSGTVAGTFSFVGYAVPN